MLSIFLFCVLLMVLWDKGPIGRALREVAVNRPARRLSEIKPLQWAALLVVGVIAVGAYASVGIEAAHVMAMAAPELFAWALMFDAALVMEVAVAAVVIASRARLAAIGAVVRAWISRLIPSRALWRRQGHARRPRFRCGSSSAPARRDDDPAPGWGLAAA